VIVPVVLLVRFTAVMCSLTSAAFEGSFASTNTADICVTVVGKSETFVFSDLVNISIAFRDRLESVERVISRKLTPEHSDRLSVVCVAAPPFTHEDIQCAVEPVRGAVQTCVDLRKEYERVCTHCAEWD